MRLAQRTAVITGAGHGIGRACALAFAAEGARVMVADIDSDGAGGLLVLASTLLVTTYEERRGGARRSQGPQKCRCNADTIHAARPLGWSAGSTGAPVWERCGRKASRQDLSCILDAGATAR